MKKTIFILSLSATTVLTGCYLAPTYEQPQSNLPQSWELEQQDKEKASALEVKWQEMFTDPQLQKVIAYGLEHNKDLRLAVLNIEEARAIYGIQRAELLPNVDAVGSVARERTSKETGGGNRTISSTYKANLASTAYELDLFGRVQNLSKAALEDWLATVEAKKAVQISLIAEISNAYLQWLADKDILTLTKSTLDAQLQSYDLLVTSRQSGVASDLDVAQITQAVEAARANLALYTRVVEQDENALRVLLGTFDTKELLLETSILNDVILAEKAFVGTPSDVILQRPDVLQAEHTLKALNANIGAARAAFLPRITLTGGYGFASNDFSNLFSGDASGAWSFMPQISIPIFNGGANFANLKASKVRKEKAVVLYEKAIQNAFQEIANVLSARKTLSTQLQAQQSLVEASQTAYDLSFARYKIGVDNFLNVLDAQRSLFAAQQTAIQLKRQVIANGFDLYKALGGGLAK